jgi:hypothetical protein
MSAGIFSHSLLCESVQKELGDSLKIRPLELADYERGNFVLLLPEKYPRC